RPPRHARHPMRPRHRRSVGPRRRGGSDPGRHRQLDEPSGAGRPAGRPLGRAGPRRRGGAPRQPSRSPASRCRRGPHQCARSRTRPPPGANPPMHNEATWQLTDEPAEGGTWLLDLVAAVDYLRRGIRPNITVWDALDEALRWLLTEADGSPEGPDELAVAIVD